jgi:hypothetical protein
MALREKPANTRFRARGMPVVTAQARPLRLAAIRETR